MVGEGGVDDQKEGEEWRKRERQSKGEPWKGQP